MNKKDLKFLATAFLVVICSTLPAFAQEDEVIGDDLTNVGRINTALPSLTIAPDARSGAMGDVGAATLPDVYSQYWNPAKYAFNYSRAGLAISYTPWLRKLIDDIALVYVSGFYKLGEEDNQAISASIRYFSIGDIKITNDVGDPLYNVAPYEMAFDVAYSRKLTSTFAGSVALRYMRNDYTTGQGNETEAAGNAFAFDVAGYNESYLWIGEAESMLGLGFNFSNIGTKISNDGGANNYFIPANMRLGASLLYPVDEYNSFSVSADISKLLVPSFQMETQEEIDNPQIAWQRYSDMSSISGIFKSFYDAPGGFKEELQELSFSIGAEYTYNNMFSIRAGYFHENEMKGNRKYFTAGAGFRMSAFQIDAAYLVSTVPNNPLDQTIRVSLSFDMDGLKGLVN